MDKPKITLVPKNVGMRTGTVKILGFEQTVKYMRLNFNKNNTRSTYINKYNE